MHKNLLKGLMVLALAVTGTGCGVHAKVYSQDRARVDQELPAGTPMEGRKMTRKVYFLEISKEEKQKKNEEAAKPAEALPQLVAEPAAKNFTWSATPATEASVPGVSLPTTYTIEKDDTLQSIAKKFYNSYGKWTKIYDANKDKLPNPDRIKAGTVITIPKI